MSTTTVVGAPPAPLGRRVAAALVDGALTSVAATPLWLSAWPRVTTPAVPGGDAAVTVSVQPLLLVVGVVVLAAWGGVQWWFQGTRGWTVGRRLLGLRTVDVRSGRPVGLGRALGRALVVSLGAIACGIGQVVVLASVLWDGSGRHRGWHDRAADAVVVDVRGLPAARRVQPQPAYGAGPTGAYPGGTQGAGAPQPGAPGTPAPDGGAPAPWSPPVGPGGVPTAPPAPDAPERTRWSSMAAERRLDAPDLVLPPLRQPGVSPDLDTRSIPAVTGPVPSAPFPPAPAPAPYPPAPGAPAAPSPFPAAGHPGHAAPVPPGPSAAPAAEPLPDLSWPTQPWPADVAGGRGDARGAAAGWDVRMPDGTVLPLDDGPLLVGRNPDPLPGVRPVAVLDPGRSVSKTHLLLGLDDAGPWVVDRGSTNGTLVTLPDGQRVVCLPDRRVRLTDGSWVTFGDLSLGVGVRA